MSDDPINAVSKEISEEINAQWERLERRNSLPAIRNKDGLHGLTNHEELTDREKGIYQVGVLRGLEFAAIAVDRVKKNE